MTVSAFELFSVGIGPSSSHTVGPMRAACLFVEELAALGVVSSLDEVGGVRVVLYGSLAATGLGHGTFPAVLLGLEGWRPELITAEQKEKAQTRLRREGVVRVGRELPASGATVRMREDDIELHPRVMLERHPNGMCFTARVGGEVVLERRYYSVGGGFVVGDEEAPASVPGDEAADVATAFSSGAELVERAEAAGSVSAAMMAFEVQRGGGDERAVRERLLALREVMEECARSGMARDGVLPGALQVPRRAKGWLQRLAAEDPDHAPEFAEDWANLVAIAVNEENASGGRVVTAPTNGAAGIIPAVLSYALGYTPAGRADRDDATVRFLLAAAAVGSLFKERASISGAEMGCQGEVGSAASMAAAGLAEVLGGTPRQVENAAEIAMEHSLGLTCDPIGGLVQIPCIERNAISAGKAVNAARMALRGDGSHRVSLDAVIETMRQTGRDMDSRYKETALGGLAATVPVSVVEC
ncbi:L-serine ammonia-lyase [Herbiconiux sp. KACC 21604]|uniref:L-serine ammonia-lyase n=1 Tax=unclassified Herbiconiux TaxID=2618217 RepID=UPI001491B9C7|nr:L-serine ammonia-lyase [Herbiconiux sp. SALV-R1]QJU55821.1 L-serine ammonia-lyase [Herbiconiux sp. SALV-R1]WPO87035.1 L-serine ammonia-lyase [Herbiconiux sp. KACC 21604]